jgi:predicted nucleotidyltransferase
MESLFAKNVLNVPSILFLNQDEVLHQSKIVTLSNLRAIQVQRVLQRLHEEGIVEMQKQGNMVCYKLQVNHPLFWDLKNILYKTVLIAEPIKNTFTNSIDQIDMLFIYGSFANGSETAESDIDLFIAGKLGLKEVSKLIIPIAKQLQREINPVVYSKTELIKKMAQKDHFITSLLSAKKLWLIGDENDFRKMEEGR